MGEITNYPYGVQGSPVIGADLLALFSGTSDIGVGRPSRVFFVDGDLGSDANDGLSPASAFDTINHACSVAGKNAVVYVKALEMAAGATDPVNYAETIIIPATAAGLKLIGVGAGPAQGGLPQIKKGSGAVAMLTVRAPGCVIANLGFNMGSSTGAGILLDDDGSTKSAFGTIIDNCHFKNNANKTTAAGGGAVAWSSNGGAWQSIIRNSRFYECCTGINLLGTGGSVPQDVVIDNCNFGGTAANIDADIMLAGGSGMNGILIRRCNFATVDLPQKAGGTTLRYLDLTGCVNGALVECTFARTGGTYGAAGDSAKIPTTIRMARNYQENAIITRT